MGAEVGEPSHVELVTCKLGSGSVLWASGVPDGRAGGPGLLEPQGEPGGAHLLPPGLWWAWSRDICNPPGAPSRPFIGVHSWAAGLPEGSHSEAGRATAGAALHKGSPEASACESRGGGRLLHPVSGTKAQLRGPPRPSPFEAAEGSRPSWPGSLIKQLPPGTHRPVAGAPKCAHKPCDPVKVRPRPAGLRARGSGPGGLSACSSASLRVSTTPPRSLHQTLSQLEVAPCVSSPHPRGVAQHLPEGLLRLSEGTAACSEFIYARNSSAESAWTLDKGRLSGMPRGRAADVMG